MSPTIFIVPAREPKKSSSAGSAGSILAIGLPLLVMTIGSPVAFTRSMILKHCLLNELTDIVFMFMTYTLTWPIIHHLGLLRAGDFDGQVRERRLHAANNFTGP